MALRHGRLMIKVCFSKLITLASLSESLIFPGGADGASATSVHGSFQWISDYPPGPEYCYFVPWADCRVCGKYVETSNNCPADGNSGGNNEDNNGDENSGGNNGGSHPPPPSDSGNGGNNGEGENNGEGGELPPNPNSNPSPNPNPGSKPLVSKNAEWFVLKQERSDQEVCLDIASQGGNHWIVQKACSLSASSQQWGTDLVTKGGLQQEAGNGLLPDPDYPEYRHVTLPGSDPEKQ